MLAVERPIPRSPRRRLPAGPRRLPAVYHAFAHFGHQSGDGPTIAAQLGPMHPRVYREFWRAFYERLAASLDVEDAMMAASQRPLLTPVVLFLRHRFGRQFTRQGDDARRSPTWPTFGAGRPRRATPLTPAQVTADLRAPRDLLDAAKTLEARYARSGSSSRAGPHRARAPAAGRPR